MRGAAVRILGPRVGPLPHTSNLRHPTFLLPFFFLLWSNFLGPNNPQICECCMLMWAEPLPQSILVDFHDKISSWYHVKQLCHLSLMLITADEINAENFFRLIAVIAIHIIIPLTEAAAKL